MNDVKSILRKERPRDCRHSGAFLARNGSLAQIGAWCDTCLSWVTQQVAWHPGHWLPSTHEKLKGVDVSALPIRPVAWYRSCERCHEWTVCEVHHVAPRQYFGDECEKWPILYLCRPCHEAWHTIVTPGLCTAYDPAAHARQTFDTLDVEKARAFYKALAAEGLRRRGAA